ncbi:MAG: 30S ribosome-binding factor RbfA [Candidatus Mcinerneyibacterium aminivorans]|uniref:Ribosome-binding factor A n=1 Tax=Candidatus Mcinerneyibacterium aminivorans TaxID=2703815 RepID=A0A5D0MHW1_9BACT|nr:MAG: 30S ribosome-binding factor RbfA [Candidatus Mcinerneyibacterium aminivorans]
MTNRRMRRVNKHVQEALGRIINEEYDYSKTGLITVNKVEVSRDLRHAKVYVSILLEDEQDFNREDVIDMLDREEYHIKDILKNRITLKYLPELHFILDESLEKAEKIYDIIEKHNKDKKNDNE